MKNRVLIVGGGAIGLAIGWRLAKAGREVEIFERDRIENSASWISAGMLTPLAEVQFQEEEILHLGLKSLSMFSEFVEELEADTGCSVGHRKDGVLLVGISQDDVAHLRFRHRFQQDLGLPTAWLSGAEAREKEPHLSPQISAAVWCGGDQQVDNRGLLNALKTGFLQAGGQFREATPVASVEIENGRVRGVRTDQALHEATTVVLAAGCWSRLIPGLPDAVRPPVRPVRGQIMRLRMTPDVTLRTIVWYGRTASSSVAYMVPKSDGTLVLGATSEEMGFDTNVTGGGMFELLRAAWEAVPGVYDLPILETRAGLRPGSRDDAPILGPSPVEGLVMATGHFRKGILLVPLTARAIASVILERTVPEDIRAFGIGRFLKDAP